MQRIALAITLATLALAPVAAQDSTPETKPAAKSTKLLLWKVTHTETKAESYLFGTIHVPDPRVLALPAPVQKAFDGAGALYCELALEPSLQLKATQHMMLPQGKSLGDIIGQKNVDRATALMAKKGMPMQPMFLRLKPWAFTSQLQQILDYLPELQRGLLPLDAKLYNEAKAAGKTVGGLEKIEDQLKVFDELSEAAQKEMATATLDEMEKAVKEGRKTTDEILKAYLKGDIESILEKNQEESAGNEELEAMGKRLLDDRNVNMAKEIARLLEKSPETSHFFAVGAAHYPGEKGIVALLKAKGYTVERVPAK